MLFVCGDLFSNVGDFATQYFKKSTRYASLRACVKHKFGDFFCTVEHRQHNMDLELHTFFLFLKNDKNNNPFAATWFHSFVSGFFIA